MLVNVCMSPPVTWCSKMKQGRPVATLLIIKLTSHSASSSNGSWRTEQLAAESRGRDEVEGLTGRWAKWRGGAKTGYSRNVKRRRRGNSGWRERIKGQGAEDKRRNRDEREIDWEAARVKTEAITRRTAFLFFCLLCSIHKRGRRCRLGAEHTGFFAPYVDSMLPWWAAGC